MLINDYYKYCSSKWQDVINFYLDVEYSLVNRFRAKIIEQLTIFYEPNKNHAVSCF